MHASAPRWITLGSVVVALVLVAVLWRHSSLGLLADPEELASRFAPYRESWFAWPMTILAFVLLELVFFPVLALIFMCGIAFGPWVGALYALSGSLASALVTFGIGRRLGRRRIERWGGAPVAKLGSILARRGVLAVFLVRKVPAPFTLGNLVCGASPVKLRDFVLGTVLGMGVGIVMISVLGMQLVDVVRDPRPDSIALVIAYLLVTIALAFGVQAAVNRSVARRS